MVDTSNSYERRVLWQKRISSKQRAGFGKKSSRNTIKIQESAMLPCLNDLAISKLRNNLAVIQRPEVKAGKADLLLRRESPRTTSAQTPLPQPDNIIKTRLVCRPHSPFNLLSLESLLFTSPDSTRLLRSGGTG